MHDRSAMSDNVMLTRQIDALGDKLEHLDDLRTPRHSIEYAKLEDEWWKLHQQRKPTDEVILPLPIADHWEIAYKAAVIHRIVDFEPERADDLWGQHAYQVEAFARRCAAFTAGL